MEALKNTHLFEKINYKHCLFLKVEVVKSFPFGMTANSTLSSSLTMEKKCWLPECSSGIIVLLEDRSILTVYMYVQYFLYGRYIVVKVINKHIK